MAQESMREFFERLRAAAAADNISETFPRVRRLLQLARFADKELGEEIRPADSLRAFAFWHHIVGTHTLKDKDLKRKALEFYAVVWASASGVAVGAVHALAREHLGDIVRACEKNLSTFPPPADVVQLGNRPRPALYVAAGTDINRDAPKSPRASS